MRKCLLTTKDNPFDPYDDFDAWKRYDEDKQYNSCGLLARIARTSDQLTEQENDREIERAIDEIVKYDPLRIYEKKIKDVEESFVS